MIVIVDYGMGNLGSILNMLKKIAVPAIISNKHDEIQNAEKLILPGVGAFDNGMKNLTDLGITEILNKKVLEQQTPVLGICLGMQLMAKDSEEGKYNGLGWFNASVIRFQFSEHKPQLKIPHMGWNTVTPSRESNLIKDLPNESRFYFVHSFHYKNNEKRDILLTTNYGYEFTSAVCKKNIFGVQFHPEKSHKFGMAVLNNFSKVLPGNA